MAKKVKNLDENNMEDIGLAMDGSASTDLLPEGEDSVAEDAGIAAETTETMAEPATETDMEQRSEDAAVPEWGHTPQDAPALPAEPAADETAAMGADEEAAPEIHFLETLEQDASSGGDFASLDAPAAPIEPAPGPADETNDPAPAIRESEPEEPAGERPAAVRKPRRDNRSAFDRLDIRSLDRSLSTDQRREWEKIYASYRSKSILNGTVLGVDRNRFAITGEDGTTEERIVYTPVIIDYRVKVLIPETELWMPGEERSDYVVRGLMGTKIDYVVTNIDREGEVVIASRRLALIKRRRMFGAMRTGNRPGDHIQCNVLSVGQRRCLVECGGYDLVLMQSDLSYPYIQDLRETYHSGMVLEAVIKEFNPGEHKLVISVKEVNPNPMEGAENRHPVGCRRIATITNKYKGGIFCKLEDGLTCLALYSNDQLDTDFLAGDRVGVHIVRMDLSHGLFFGRIVTKL